MGSALLFASVIALEAALLHNSRDATEGRSRGLRATSRNDEYGMAPWAR
jgi:hypothetical protein